MLKGKITFIMLSSLLIWSSNALAQRSDIPDPFKLKIVEVATKEWESFGRQTMKNDTLIRVGKKENDEGYWQKVVKYWKEGTGRSDVDTKNEVHSDNNPWSAAFVSYVMKTSGGGSRFKYSNSHYTYIVDSIRNRKNGDLGASFVGYKTSETQGVPTVGDLVCAPRGADAKKVTYDNALTYINKDNRKFFTSHCDIVVAVRNDEIDVIGGNVSDSVTKNTLATRNGKLIPSLQRNWFVVIKNNV